MHIDDKLLELKNLPEHLNNIDSITDHFKQFGEIVNVWVCMCGDMAAHRADRCSM